MPSSWRRAWRGADSLLILFSRSLHVGRALPHYACHYSPAGRTRWPRTAPRHPPHPPLVPDCTGHQSASSPLLFYLYASAPAINISRCFALAWPGGGEVGDALEEADSFRSVSPGSNGMAAVTVASASHSFSKRWGLRVCYLAAYLCYTGALPRHLLPCGCRLPTVACGDCPTRPQPPPPAVVDPTSLPHAWQPSPCYSIGHLKLRFLL